MPLPERITDACEISERWLVDPTLMMMIVALDAWADQGFRDPRIPWLAWPGLYILSGYRTASQQADVNPDVPNSLHRRCPSLAVDLRVGNVYGLSSNAIWELLGGRWKAMGGRWGGDFDPGKDITGVNRREQNHFDRG